MKGGLRIILGIILPHPCFLQKLKLAGESLKENNSRARSRNLKSTYRRAGREPHNIKVDGGAFGGKGNGSKVNIHETRSYKWRVNDFNLKN